MKELVSVMRAADFAAKWHTHQRRKGAALDPYINHLLEVASLVTEATNGTQLNVVIAALLHDAIEDQSVTAETIASEFGNQVADIVMEVSDDKTPPKAERKRKRLKSASKKSREAKLIKLADEAICGRWQTVPRLIGRSSNNSNTSNGQRTWWLAFAVRRLGLKSSSMKLPARRSGRSVRYCRRLG